MTFAILFRRAVSDLWHDLGNHLLTTTVVCLSTLIFAFFSLIYFNLQHFVERFGTELGLVVYLDQGTPREKIPELYQRLNGLPGVQAVKYVSPAEAFERLRAYLKDEKGALEGIEPDFLPPSFEVTINRAVYNLDRLKAIADQVTGWKEVSRVQYGQEWLTRLKQFSDIVRGTCILSGILLLLTAAFVVSNTIKLTVYSRKEELEILRLVGATNGFIQGPFLIEAFIQGLAGSCTALGVLYAGYTYLASMVDTSLLLRGLDISFLPWSFAGVVVACSVLLCVLGTSMSMKRFLRL